MSAFPQDQNTDTSSQIIVGTSGDTIDTSQIRPNSLRKYASMNYVITLQVTTPKLFSKMITNQEYVPTDWFNICRSGGIGDKRIVSVDDTGNLNPEQYFSKDLYIEDVIINTLCGLTQYNRGSNAIDVELTVNEPYGMDFIEQLYDFCKDGLQESNYNQLPYMLIIQFKGFLDDGSFFIDDTLTKYIPIHLINMDIKLSNAGSVYKISAMAYNDMGNSEKYGRLPQTCETPAGDTIRQYGEYLAAIINTQQQSLAASQNNNDLVSPDVYVVKFIDWHTDGDGGIGAFANDTESWTSATGEIPVAKDSQMGTVTDFTGQFSSTLFGRNVLQYSKTIQNTDNSVGTSAGAVTFTNGGKVIFNSGSSIIDCLNTLIINSKYITDQIKTYNQKVADINRQAATLGASAATDANLAKQVSDLSKTPLNWFVIIPKIDYMVYDNARKSFGSVITYTIRPYVVYNCKSDSAPNGDPSGRVVKKYDYLFTGTNTEVLNFDISFNNAFLTYSSFNAYTRAQGTGSKMPDNTNTQQPASSSTTASAPLIVRTKSGIYSNGMSTVLVSGSDNNSTGVGSTSPDRVRATDVASTIYTNSDQVQMDISIMGDPDFIKQDGVFLDTPLISTTPYLPSGQGKPGGIAFNDGEIYMLMNFKVPTDLNQDTGLMDVSYKTTATEYRRNVFSGLYKVITVENRFQKGAFIQKLSTVRWNDSHDQEIGSATTPLAQ